MFRIRLVWSSIGLIFSGALLYLTGAFNGGAFILFIFCLWNFFGGLIECSAPLDPKRKSNGHFYDDKETEEHFIYWNLFNKKK